MFETRLKIVLGVFGLALLVIVVRLIDLQIVRGAEFRKQADEALLCPRHMVPFVRGRILDRSGVELAADHPCWEIAVHYGVLAMKPAHLRRQARRLRTSTDPGMSLTEAEAEVRRQIDHMWQDISRLSALVRNRKDIFLDGQPTADGWPTALAVGDANTPRDSCPPRLKPWATPLSGESVEDLLERARHICARIARVRKVLEDYHGYEFPIEEERMAHAVVEGLDDQDQIAARQVLQDYPWVEVRASTYRYYHRSHALPHILGQLGAVTEATLAGDPNKGNELTRYRSTEKLGVSGVEYAAEGELRGRRGLFQQNRAGQVVENISAVNGADVTLTLRLDLQEALYELMAEMLPNTPYPSGGAIVVLDVPTREVLALVSYPGYDSRDYRKHYNELAGDMRRQPLRFRAIANAYAPGSIMKPLTCIAGLSLGKITLTTTFDCQGYYYPKTRSGRKCWRIHGTNRRKAHGPLMVSDAIAHSCNIFMYHTGERVGVRGLCDYFDMAGVGRSSGVGLPEAARGINPTESYINSRGRSVTKGDAWNYAIGQGEVNMTPLQTANLMAVYAGGIYKPVTLIRTGSEPAQWRLPVKAQHWRAIRSGLFRVTNERGATAYKTAHFVRDGYALCGKTGSATVWPAVVSYTIPYTTAAGEEAVAIVPGNSKREAGERFEAHYGEMDFEWGLVVPHDYWPPLQGSHKRPAKGDEKEHAWFIAYLQAVDRSGAPMLDVTPRIAFSVLVEFGGSGGRAAGPIAARVADILLDTLGPGLDPDAVRDDTRP